MNVRKWRNPYDPLKRRQPAAHAGATRAALTSPPRKLALPALPLDIRTSVTRIRSNIKGISSTIRQMEETMDTLYNAIEMVSSLGKAAAKENPPQRQKSGRGASRRAEDDAAQDDATGHPLGNLDLQQLLQILQSPLVQSLLGQTSKSEERKKEG